VLECHCPPRAVRMPRALSASAISRRVVSRDAWDRPHNRQDIGRKLIGRGTVRHVRLHRRLGRSRIVEFGAGSFLGCKGGLGASSVRRLAVCGNEANRTFHKPGCCLNS
jgi:hypothetical protein